LKNEFNLAVKDELLSLEAFKNALKQMGWSTSTSAQIENEAFEHLAQCHDIEINSEHKTLFIKR